MILKTRILSIFLFNSPVHFIVGPRVIMNEKLYWAMQLLTE